MKDLTTPLFPFAVGRVGKNESGVATPGLVTALELIARTSRDWLWASRLLLDRRSTPFVLSVTLQLLVQLGKGGGSVSTCEPERV